MMKKEVQTPDKVLERLWLNYYNDTLYSRGLITKIEYFMMRKLIIVSAGRKSPFGDADKILDQIRLQEVPHVHL